MQLEYTTHFGQSISTAAGRALPAFARGLALLVLAGLLTACGGSGGSDDDDDSAAPTARILFPPAKGVTDADTITVTGTAAGAGTVTLVRVNGVDAISSDGFATWRAVVPLVPGANALVVETRDQAGNANMNADSASLLNQPVYTTPWDLAFDAAGNRLLMTDRISRSLIGIDFADGSHDKISGRAEAAGRPEALTHDASGDRVIVFVDGSNRLDSIDLATGAYSLFSANNGVRGTGPNFVADIRALVIDESPGAGLERVLAVEGLEQRIYAVDLASGDRSILSEDGVNGMGDPFAWPKSIAVDGASNRALVGDDTGGDGNIFAVDLTSGDRSIISPDDGNFARFTDLALDSASDTLYALEEGNRQILKIDVGSGMNQGQRTTLSGNGGGSGPEFFIPVALVLDTVGNRLLVADDGLDAVFAVDLVTGERSIVDDNGFGSGVDYNPSLVEIELDPDTDQVYVYDRDRIVSVGLDSAVRTIVTDDSDFQGNDVGGNAAGIAIDLENNQMLVATARPGTLTNRLVGVDLASGERTEIASPSPDAHQVSSIIYDSTTDRAITVILTPDKPRLNQIDLVTGDESAFSGSIFGLPAVGAGDDFQFIPLGGIALDVVNDRVLVMQDWGTFFRMYAADLPTGDRSLAIQGDEAPEFGNILGKMVIDTSRNRLLILDERNEIVDFPAVVTLDLGDESKAILSNADIGEGIELKTPKDIAFHPGRDLAVVLDRGVNALIAVDLESGDRVLFSK